MCMNGFFVFLGWGLGWGEFVGIGLYNVIV